MPSVLVCVTSRDGRLRKEIDYPLTLALRTAADAGIGVASRLEVNHYGVTICRNQVVASFLQSEHSHLLFVDDDVIVPADCIPALLACDADVAGGVYPFLRRDDDGVHAVLSASIDGEWPREWFDGQRDAVCVGGGCMLIRRDVFNAVGFPWFRWPERLRDDGTVAMVSDDLDFCKRATVAGQSIVVHGNVRCGHLKDIDLRDILGAEVMR